jgi:hypothetical protein
MIRKLIITCLNTSPRIYQHLSCRQIKHTHFFSKFLKRDLIAVYAFLIKFKFTRQFSLIQLIQLCGRTPPPNPPTPFLAPTFIASSLFLIVFGWSFKNLQLVMKTCHSECSSRSHARCESSCSHFS